MRQGIGTLVVLSLALGGCALQTPPTQTEVLKQALPEGTQVPPTWKTAARAGSVTGDWLKRFNDPGLDAIVAESMANNLDLRQAADRVTMAR
jgi:outer membrane protein TolC